MALRETDQPVGEPWERRLSGRLERLTVDSDLLRDNPLGDPARRPLYLYLSPGVAEGDAGRVPVVYLLQGYSNQLDTWLARKPFEPTIVVLSRMPTSTLCSFSAGVVSKSWRCYG